MTEVCRSDLPTTDKMVLLALADAANDDGVTWMALESKEGVKLDLLKKTSLSRRAVQQALSRLCDAGYLSRTDRPGKGVIWTVKGCTSCAPQEMRPAPRAPGGAAGAPKSSTNPQPTSEADASSVGPRTPTIAKAEIARGFLTFWAAYPKRKAKDTAAKAFTKAMNRIGGDDPLAVILAGIERALPGWDDPQFIPHPATWLNAGSWEDDAPTPRNGPPHDRPADNRRPSATYSQPSRAERDQSAALAVLARRGLLPGQDQARGVHDGPAGGLAQAG